MKAKGRPVVTLTTDFGTADPYVGAMKGVILSINPDVSIVDISHDVHPQSILEAAFVIGNSHEFFPQGVIHVVVVDPGVGTSRMPLLMATPSATFVAPDNGVLTRVIREGFRQPPEVAGDCRVPVPEEYAAYHLTNQRFWLHPVSSTFHGRDIFAPVAAHLSLGVSAHLLGEKVDHLAWLPQQQPTRDGDTLTGQVVHVDHCGNLITNIPADELSGRNDLIIEIKGHHIAGLSSSYAEGGWPLAIVGSLGDLEISVRDGSAARELQAGVGDTVRVDVGHRTISP